MDPNAIACKLTCSIAFFSFLPSQRWLGTPRPLLTLHGELSVQRASPHARGVSLTALRLSQWPRMSYGTASYGLEPLARLGLVGELKANLLEGAGRVASFAAWV